MDDDVSHKLGWCFCHVDGSSALYFESSTIVDVFLIDIKVDTEYNLMVRKVEARKKIVKSYIKQFFIIWLKRMIMVNSNGIETLFKRWE